MRSSWVGAISSEMKLDLGRHGLLSVAASGCVTVAKHQAVAMWHYYCGEEGNALKTSPSSTHNKGTQLHLYDP